MVLASLGVGEHREPRVLTLDTIRQECNTDGVMVALKDQIRKGFPDSSNDMNPVVRDFHRFGHGLCVVDGIPCYKTRIIIPAKMRKQVLAALHSAHQGVSGMTARAEQSVFWPTITRDIVEARATCRVSQDSTVSASSAAGQPTVTQVSIPVASL